MNVSLCLCLVVLKRKQDRKRERGRARRRYICGEIDSIRQDETDISRQKYIEKEIERKGDKKKWRERGI